MISRLEGRPWLLPPQTCQFQNHYQSGLSSQPTSFPNPPISTDLFNSPGWKEKHCVWLHAVLDTFKVKFLLKILIRINSWFHKRRSWIKSEERAWTQALWLVFAEHFPFCFISLEIWLDCHVRRVRAKVSKKVLGGLSMPHIATNFVEVRDRVWQKALKYFVVVKW